jgi:hypothetical protein
MYYASLEVKLLKRTTTPLKMPALGDVTPRPVKGE